MQNQIKFHKNPLIPCFKYNPAVYKEFLYYKLKLETVGVKQNCRYLSFVKDETQPPKLLLDKTSTKKHLVEQLTKKREEQLKR